MLERSKSCCGPFRLATVPGLLGQRRRIDCWSLANGRHRAGSFKLKRRTSFLLITCSEFSQTSLSYNERGHHLPSVLVTKRPVDDQRRSRALHTVPGLITPICSLEWSGTNHGLSGRDGSMLENSRWMGFHRCRGLPWCRSSPSSSRRTAPGMNGSLMGSYGGYLRCRASGSQVMEYAGLPAASWRSPGTFHHDAGKNVDDHPAAEGVRVRSSPVPLFPGTGQAT